MDKKQLDQLYHNLRELCVTDDIVQKEAVAGITLHLTLQQGNYVGLLRFLSYYGEEYILPPVVKLLQSFKFPGSDFLRIVELGAGFGWLGRGISNSFGQIPVLFVDKRQWVFTDIVADIETENGVKRVLDELRRGDLIVMSELLHCLSSPREVLEPFAGWPMLVVEYMPLDPAYHSSYNAQIQKFRCKPIDNIRDVFPDSTVWAEIADPYMIWLVLPIRGG